MTAAPKSKARGSNTPPIIVKKIIAAPQGGHHGGAWKVACADFVTAMMAFFLLMWPIGATNEKQRKGLADDFAPTLVDRQQGSAGDSGLFGGDSMTSTDAMPHAGKPGGTAAMTVPRAVAGDPPDPKAARGRDEERFDALAKRLTEQLARRPEPARAARALRMVKTRDGLRIDLVDSADFATFGFGSDRLTPQGRALLATRAVLAQSGIAPDRFQRIEGVADREPLHAADPLHPSNRRMSVTLGWSSRGGCPRRRGPGPCAFITERWRSPMNRPILAPGAWAAR